VSQRRQDVLTPEELVRYSRQILLAGFGEEGQKRLRRAHVVVAGIGGLGSPASIYLACAGVGRLTLVDRDRVELSNLNRQVLHWEEDVDIEKVCSAARKLRGLNSTVEVVPLEVEITPENARRIVRGADLVVDGMDNMRTRLLLNDACLQEGIPFIHGGVHGLMGEVTTILPGRTPCLACIFSQGTGQEVPFPVLGATPALIASIQVMEAIKLLCGFGELLAGRMLLVDGERMEFTTVRLQRNPRCPACGEGEG